MLRRRLFTVLAAATALAACDQAGQEVADSDMRDKLVGTWLREINEGEFKVRRVLVLQSTGGFNETTRVTDGEGVSRTGTADGYWVFDGINFKRKYTRVDNGELSGGRITFATFQIKSVSPREFTGVDNVRNIEVTYRRVDEGTQA
jgi:hypothetical protein